MNKRKYKTGLMALMIASTVLVGTAPSGYTVVQAKEKESEAVVKQSKAITGKKVFLSDIDYVKDLSFANENHPIATDKNSENRPIHLLVNGQDTEYRKGIGFDATGEVVYDLTKHSGYSTFSAVVGLDYSKKDETYFESGAILKVLTSTDGTTWDEEYNSGVIYPRNEATEINIDITGKKYLKLVGDKNGNNWWSHWYDLCVFANAELRSADYSNTTDITQLIKPVSEYDQIIKQAQAGSTDVNIVKHDLLMRELVNRAGYDNLAFSIMNYPEYKACFEWLTEDVNRLESWVLGGIAEGSNKDAEAIDILSKIYSKHKADFTDNRPLRTTTGTRGELNLRIAMAISLTHGLPIESWIGGKKDGCNISDPLEKYEAYQSLYDKDRLYDIMFESLKLEEMRWVMNDMLDSESIEWLNEFANANPEDTWVNRPHADPKIDPYTYIEYGFGYNYNDPQYFDPSRYAEWDAKYNLSKYNLTYQQGYPKLWTVFEEGAVCGGLSKTGTNLQAVYGIPSTVTGQPGHASYVFLLQNPDGSRKWTMFNGVSTWAETGKVDRMHEAMPLNWGVGDGGFRASYLLLSQRAINNYNQYVKAEYKTWLADVYKDDFDKYTDILTEAIRELPYHFEAWAKLVDLKEQLTNDQIYELMKGMARGLQYDAKPFYDLATQLGTVLTQDNNYLGLYNKLLENTLKGMQNIQDNTYEYTQYQKDIATYLLGQTNTKVVDFSFDGEDKNKIIFNSGFTEGMVWEYRLDGKEDNDGNWKQSNNLRHELTADEVAQITADHDIKIHIVGTPITPDNIYTIDILEGIRPDDLCFNDLENRPVGLNESHEYRKQGETEWKEIKGTIPRFEGDQVIEVRKGATGVYLASDFNTYTFTEDNQPEDRVYVPIENLTLAEFSTQNNDTSEKALNILDGRNNTIWHSSYDHDDERFITVKLDTSRTISAVEYVPRIQGQNGRAKKISVYTSTDGNNYTLAKTVENLENNHTVKLINFDKPVECQYIKIVLDETYGDTANRFATGAMVNIFEDREAKTPLTVDVKYSTTKTTNQDVVVELVNPNRPIKVLNNKGSMKYTFKKNGTFTFKYEDTKGIRGEKTIKVDWIDKDAPKATITGIPTKPTNKDVTVTIKFNEPVRLETQNKNITKISEQEYKIAFIENGTVSGVFTDKAGNKTPVKVVVNKIDKKTPTGKITYTKKGNKVIATLKTDEPCTILNNKGQNTYTFTKNGQFTFVVVDSAGNRAEIKATVNSLNKPANNKPNNSAGTGKPNNKPSSKPSKPNKPNKPNTNNTKPVENTENKKPVNMETSASQGILPAFLGLMGSLTCLGSIHLFKDRKK